MTELVAEGQVARRAAARGGVEGAGLEAVGDGGHQVAHAAGAAAGADQGAAVRAVGRAQSVHLGHVVVARAAEARQVRAHAARLDVVRLVGVHEPHRGLRVAVVEAVVRLEDREVDQGQHAVGAAGLVLGGRRVGDQHVDGRERARQGDVERRAAWLLRAAAHRVRRGVAAGRQLARDDLAQDAGAVGASALHGPQLVELVPQAHARGHRLALHSQHHRVVAVLPLAEPDGRARARGAAPLEQQRMGLPVEELEHDHALRAALRGPVERAQLDEEHALLSQVRGHATRVRAVVVEAGGGHLCAHAPQRTCALVGDQLGRCEGRYGEAMEGGKPHSSIIIRIIK